MPVLCAASPEAQAPDTTPAPAAGPALAGFADLLIELLAPAAAQSPSGAPRPGFSEHIPPEQADRRPEHHRPEQQDQPPEAAVIALAIAPPCPAPEPTAARQAGGATEASAAPVEPAAAPPPVPPESGGSRPAAEAAPSAAAEGKPAAGLPLDAELSPAVAGPSHPAPPPQELPAAPEGIEIKTQAAPLGERAPVAFALRLRPPAEPSPEQQPSPTTTAAQDSPERVARRSPAERSAPSLPAAEPRPAARAPAQAGPQTAEPVGEAPPARPEGPEKPSQDPPVPPAAERPSATVPASETRPASDGNRPRVSVPPPAAGPATPEKRPAEATESSPAAHHTGPSQAPPRPAERQAGDPAPARSPQPAADIPAVRLENRRAAPAPQEISLRISAKPRPEASAETVALRLIERAGRIHVSVRSADPALADSLRRELPTLVEGLERGGFRSEVLEAGALAPPARAWAMERASGDRPEQSGQASGWQGQPDAQRERRHPGPFAPWEEALEESGRASLKSLGGIRHDDAR